LLPCPTGPDTLNFFEHYPFKFRCRKAGWEARKARKLIARADWSPSGATWLGGLEALEIACA